MNATTYLNFELLIEPWQKAYRARVQYSPVGEAWELFTLPFSQAELSAFLPFVGQRSLGRGGEKSSPQIFGARLYTTVFHGAVGRCLARSLDAAKRQRKGLRIRLRLNEVPELAQLPWEYLYDPVNQRFFVLSDQTPIVRYLEMQGTEQPLELARPLRILMG